MRVLIAPDKFAGTMSAEEAGNAIASGWLSVYPEDTVRVVPMADGGPGSVSAVSAATGIALRYLDTTDQRGRPVRAPVAAIDEATAMIEAASACGLDLVPEDERAPLEFDSRGLGILLRAVMDLGFQKVLVGLGGSGTVDCGVGAALALGAVIEGATGERFDFLPPSRFEEIRRVGQVPRLTAEVVAVSDVNNPLLGASGAAHVFGPQKGASPSDVEALEAALAHVARVVEDSLPGGPWRDRPGAGAAGGLGFGLMAWTGASMAPGARLIGEIIGLRDHIEWSEFVVSGEGSMDSQSLAGKAPYEVLRAAERLGRASGVVAGRIEPMLDGRLELAETLGEIGLEDPVGEAHRAGARIARRAHSLPEEGR